MERPAVRAVPDIGEGHDRPLAIADLNTQFGVQWGTMTALATLFSLPVIIVTFFLQRRIVTGATMGAVKG